MPLLIEVDAGGHDLGTSLLREGELPLNPVIIVDLKEMLLAMLSLFLMTNFPTLLDATSIIRKSISMNSRS